MAKRTWSVQFTEYPATSPVRDWRRFVYSCEVALGDDRRDKLATELGVSTDALKRLRTGYSDEHGAFTFPMFDAAGRLLGARLRGCDGRKWSVRGGHEGLFIPRIDDRAAVNYVVVCEGPTDCAALLDVGFHAIGRPSCSGGVKHLVELVKRMRPDDVAILADDDSPGIRGANILASVLNLYAQRIRVVTPPPGAKDVRHWRQRGATHEDVQRRIDSVEPRQLAILVKGGIR
jgi:hypothetical protein